jgi:hypothetical protein
MADEPRDFLESLEDGGYLGNICQGLSEQAAIDIRALAAIAPGLASAVLCDVVRKIRLDAMQLKYIAYCLGQLGNNDSLELLREIASSELPSGVKSAAAASAVAVMQASVESGASELRRRQIIEQVYRMQ